MKKKKKKGGRRRGPGECDRPLTCAAAAGAGAAIAAAVDVSAVCLRSVKPLEHYSKGLKVRVLSKPFLLRTTTSDRWYERCKAIIGERSDVRYKTHDCLRKVENMANEGNNV